jgi:hypothetical protein
VSTFDIPKIETPRNPGINSLEPGNPGAPASVHAQQGGWLLVARPARCGDTAILANGTPGCR